MKKLILICILFCSLAKAQLSPDVVQIEYWIDGDPGFGQATDVTTLVADSIIANLVFNNVLTLNSGMHTLGIRSMDANNVWSHTNHVPFIVTAPATASIISAIEYFWDGDPGFGNGYVIPFPFALADTANYIEAVPIPNFGTFPSTHLLFSRTLDSHNIYSHTNHADTVVVTGTVNVNELNSQYGINIYPNPFNTELNIAPGQNDKMRLVLYNASGQVVLNTTITQTTKMNVEALAAGTYTVLIWRERNKIYTSTLIKQ